MNESVSSRCIHANQNDALPYKASMLKALQNPCHETQNKNGYVVLCRAENKLLLSTLKAKFLANDAELAKVAFGCEESYCYSDDVRGIKHVKEIVAHFVTRKFIRTSHALTNKIADEEEAISNKSLPMAEDDQIVLSTGVESLIHSLCHLTGEENDIVLIPAPYYAGFENDTRVVANCIPYPIHMSDPSQGPKIEELEQVYQFLQERGDRVKTLLLTNPNNPLGTIYSPTVIQNCVCWARSKNMHTIVDEIYALSVHNKNNHNFKSVIEILHNNLGNDVHFVWGLSKDFGCSGFRVGILYTHNQSILSAFRNINMFSSVPHPMQLIAGQFLSDDEYVDMFLDKSRILLHESYKIATEALGEMNIPFVRAKAGVFVYCDFSSLLRDDSFENEDELGKMFVEYGRVVLTPGRSQRDDKAGRFRLCYAFVSPEVLRIGMVRLGRICQLIREVGWDAIYNTLEEKKVQIMS